MKKNILFWLGAVLFASLLWLQNVLLSEQELIVSIPLRFDPLPQNLVFSSNTNPHVKLILQTKGINILLFQNHNVEYVTSGEQLKYGENSLLLSLDYLNCSPKMKEYVTGFTGKIKLIEMDKIVTELLPVKPVFKNSETEKFFKQKNFIISPSQVKVKGPAEMLTKIEAVNSLPVSKQDLENDKTRISLADLDNNIQLLENEIILQAAVQAEMTKTIPLVPVIFPLDATYSISPQKITVKVKGKQNVLAKLSRDDIKANLTILEDDLRGKLNIVLPPGVKLIEYTPSNIHINY